MKQYEFSVPMPYKTEFIDELISLNKRIKKSKITSLYFALPINCSDKTGFEQLRTAFYEKTDFDYWAKFIAYSIKKKFDFVYLLNSPKSFLSESRLLDCQLDLLDKLLVRLKKLGCNKLRAANTQLINYLTVNYPDFKLYASTSLEYTLMKQYHNFLNLFPQIVEIVPSYDINKNFLLLKNLREAFPKVDMEIMVNEGCMSGCPLRTHHNIAIPNMINEVFKTRNADLTRDFFVYLCSSYTKKNCYLEICKSNVIYPWEIQEYADIGINKFKLAGRNSEEFTQGMYIKRYEVYLQGIDDYENIKNERFANLNHYLNDFDKSVYEMRPYLPDINHFKKNGHLCASLCGTSCRYCYECAEKLKKSFT